MKPVGRPLAIISFSEDPPDEVVERVRAQVEASVSDEARRASRNNSPDGLANSFNVFTVGNSIIIDNDKNYARFVNEGTAGRQLWNLIGRVVPLNIRGTVIYRRVTEKALREGKFRIPAKPAKDFVRLGVNKAFAQSGGLMTRYGAELDEEVEEVWI